ncbi:hypothetical protein [Enterobacter hormaechei]|uniref:hypothetical protein n=1 Tax=Enterobacter hormaechei TaxID=158836 RepID=UPI000F2B8CC5|nr:armA_1_AY220558 [Klebsiella pneumoniae]VXR48235.1 Uncharacterised protein [Klebsiella pneumoniae]
MDKNDVVKKILESKKYENLDSDIVEKVVSISEKKYKLKEVENYSKRNCIKYGVLLFCLS